MLKENDLVYYYELDGQAGVRQRGYKAGDYDYLDREEIKERILDFREGDVSVMRFEIPQIHCASCVWLLENIHKIQPGIYSSRVNFLKKRATIRFDENKISLKELVLLLVRIGYEPRLNLASVDVQEERSQDKSLLYKLGLAGFVFGNIMLLSFPEYLGFDRASLHMYIGYINFALALPVLLYSGSDYLKSAVTSIRSGHLGIDVPVALGMLALFGRSSYEVLSQTGEGYFDSFSGFVFFLLIGKWFQSFTFQALSFERDYRSYFPISALVGKDSRWVARPLDKIKVGDKILVKNEEIIPADSILLDKEAQIDYSFVSGESRLIYKEKDQKLLAGGKLIGSSVRIKVVHPVDQSYLTKLWNEDIFRPQINASSSKLIDSISKYFTIVVLIIALLSFLVWLRLDTNKAFQVFTAVLIVACPCALALAGPFIYGNMIRLLSKSKIFCRNAKTIERMQDIQYVVFDKTGTITDISGSLVRYEGEDLNKDEWSAIASLVHQSNHPMSRSIYTYLIEYNLVSLTDFEELPGRGVRALTPVGQIELGSGQWLGLNHKEKQWDVVVRIEEKLVGGFVIRDKLRSGIKTLIRRLSDQYELAVLSGDDDSEASRMQSLFPPQTEIRFGQQPRDKLLYIKQLQKQGVRVMMIGDGLNDAGALRQADVGVVLTEKTNNFTPASDIIVEAKEFKHFDRILRYARQSKWIMYGALCFAFFYNAIGLYFAISGQLSPVIAAILMPLSSITVVVYGVVVSSLLLMRLNTKATH